jgi:hypothetical protein
MIHGRRQKARADPAEQIQEQEVKEAARVL